MSEESTTETTPARTRVLRAFVAQGIGGISLIVVVTAVRWYEPAEVFRGLQGSAAVLCATFFFTSAFLQMLRFDLTREIAVSLELTAFVVMVPLLGMVVSVWVAISAVLVARYLAIRQIGPAKIDMTDPPVEYARMFGLFGTFGIPVVMASQIYEWLGGMTPVIEVSTLSAARIMIAGIVMIVTNNLVMARVELGAYGYSPDRVLRLGMIDSSIYLLTLPYAATMSFTWVALGAPAVVTFAALMVLAYSIVREMAMTQEESRQAVQRLASLMNIGSKISLTSTRDLVNIVYEECRKVIDARVFSIALVDEKAEELVFELDVGDDSSGPARIRIGEGLNSWVFVRSEPLLLGSIREITRRGLVPIAAAVESESWLGVPIIARDRTIGVISVQSLRKNAFSREDLLMLTVVANQVGVAIDNARLYEDLENLTYDLEDRVRQRTWDLQGANLRLRAADRSKNQFLANMTHELRTPLNSIIGFSKLLLENTRDVLSPRFYRFLENVNLGGRNLLHLISDILDLAKIRAGRLEIHPEPCDLRPLIEEVRSEVESEAPSSRVRLRITIAPGTPQVMFDRTRLRQVLHNLITNAIRFSPDGEFVDVTASRIDPGDSPNGDALVRIDVSDKGVGIAPDKIERIFDDFFQEGGGIKKGGAGLGLSLVRNFVELHGGTIIVTSTPGQGATFSVYI